MNLEASIIVVTYDSERWIENCLRALQAQSFDKAYEIVVVDNGSSDKTCDIIRSKFPTARLFESENRGFGAGNNLGAKKAQGKYLAFINPDTIADSQWLVELLRPLERSGIVTTSKILLMEEPELVNTCGSSLHFTGFGFVNHYRELSENFYEDFEVDGISGAAFAMRKKDYDRCGGFDEDFFLYMEDVELSWRIKQKKLYIICAVKSTTQHKYHLEVNPNKILLLEQGRLFLLRKHLTMVSWFVLAPSLLLSVSFSFVKSVTVSPVGVYYWCKAIHKGFSYPLTGSGSPNKIWQYLTTKIPFHLFSTNVYVRKIGAALNVFYAVNFKSAVFFSRIR